MLLLKMSTQNLLMLFSKYDSLLAADSLATAFHSLASVDDDGGGNVGGDNVGGVNVGNVGGGNDEI